MEPTTISIHLANTASGDYDVRLPLPKPLHCDEIGFITRKGPEYADLVQVVGFAINPDDYEVDKSWGEWADRDPMTPYDVIGCFPVVVTADDEMAALTVPVTEIRVNGRMIGKAVSA